MYKGLSVLLHFVCWVSLYLDVDRHQTNLDVNIYAGCFTNLYFSYQKISRKTLAKHFIDELVVAALITLHFYSLSVTSCTKTCCQRKKTSESYYKVLYYTQLPIYLSQNMLLLPANYGNASSTFLCYATSFFVTNKWASKKPSTSVRSFHTWGSR